MGTTTDLQSLIEEIHDEVRPLQGSGKVADYIPALASVDPRQFGICVENLHGQIAATGHTGTRFSIQSISKVFTLTLAIRGLGARLWERLGVEPSGDPFNSLVQLEYEQGIPRNPFINAGAIVITDVLLDLYEDPRAEILRFVRQLVGKDDIHYNPVVAASEGEHGHHNRALAHLMRAYGNIRHEVERVLDIYFWQCSLEMNCRELAHAFLYLANHGVIPRTGERILNASQAKRLNAIMLTCGFYDEAGEFAFRVGMPGKSGVGGGIAGIIPNHLSITVWSPELNDHGNSLCGITALELFTTKTGLSIF